MKRSTPLLAAVAALAVFPAIAQEKYPSKPIRMVVAFPPGGLADVVARIIQEGGVPVGNTPQEFAENIRNDIAKWAKVIKDADIKPAD